MSPASCPRFQSSTAARSIAEYDRPGLSNLNLPGLSPRRPVSAIHRRPPSFPSPISASDAAKLLVRPPEFLETPWLDVCSEGRVKYALRNEIRRHFDPASRQSARGPWIGALPPKSFFRCASVAHRRRARHSSAPAWISLMDSGIGTEGREGQKGCIAAGDFRSRQMGRFAPFGFFCSTCCRPECFPQRGAVMQTNRSLGNGFSDNFGNPWKVVAATDCHTTTSASPLWRNARKIGGRTPISLVPSSHPTAPQPIPNRYPIDTQSIPNRYPIDTQSMTCTCPSLADSPVSVYGMIHVPVERPESGSAGKTGVSTCNKSVACLLRGTTPRHRDVSRTARTEIKMTTQNSFGAVEMIQRRGRGHPGGIGEIRPLQKRKQPGEPLRWGRYHKRPASGCLRVSF
jgi:hypothetical protein